MWNNPDPYSLSIEMIGDSLHYYVSFKDSQRVIQTIEVSESVYMEFHGFKKTERNLKRSYERNIEHSELTEETLYSRASDSSRSLDEKICDIFLIRCLRQAFHQLSDVQKRRLVLYYEYNLTFAQIAEKEGVSVMPVKRSINRAEEILRNFVRSYHL